MGGDRIHNEQIFGTKTETNAQWCSSALAVHSPTVPTESTVYASTLVIGNDDIPTPARPQPPGHPRCVQVIHKYILQVGQLGNGSSATTSQCVAKSVFFTSTQSYNYILK